MTHIDTFSCVRDAVAETPEQADAAIHCGVTQSRINDLLHGRVSRFPLDALMNMATDGYMLS